MKQKKSLGQHFLKSQEVVQKIVETAGIFLVYQTPAFWGMGDKR